ncbi:MmcQ/YjbR family DNA-binding protein [Microvirga sp. 17 mud 1-3]|uniref:MmcQ/YjbR family DNA-binding protein n=1 Tax=Microvirga sp. 17 mud 1-3 TaxID=2082949 RepID=UPI000D6B9C3A|nr:MmcQ/YjbR family DNA-binding protein [Microvirga sp. 17 mud 1-3]AWM85777.1 hypothetical protein C4E04_02825 [Microvirga sp. 17 mud 1-3]
MTPDDVRRLALALPETVEGMHMNHPDFRVGGKVFATLWPDEKRAVVRLEPDHQRMLVESEPAVFAAVPGGWGLKGWTNVMLAESDEAGLRSALAAAWRNVAPRRLHARL